MKYFFLLAITVSIFFCSCNFFDGKQIRGNGVVKTETRPAGQFSKIDVSGNANVYIKQDSVYSIKVETDENLMEYIITENEGNTLKIFSKERTNLKPSKSIKIYVSGPSFKHFEASGACDIFSENRIEGSDAITINLSGASNVKMEVKAPKVSAELSGAGTITLWGEAKDFIVDGSGSTNINCFDLMTENTSVELSGAGDAKVFASVKLDVHVSGAADIRYKGNPAVSKDISGAGSVKKVE